MIFLIWTILLFSVTDAGASQMKWHCQDGFCITLTEGEITAEAGLCVVIPCSFSVNSKFTIQHIVWFKCEPSKRKCVDSDVIFHTNKGSKKVQPEFKGRVSLLEPELWRRNCSIVVNDRTEYDSGSYQLRVNGQNNWKEDGYTFSPKATVSVKGLTQKPTVVIPPLTEGQQATLTCTAPGLCSGSAPEITWTWRGRGEKDSHITGNMTAFETVAKRHISTLTFNSSAEHHGSSVTCKVTFKNNISTEETVTLNVTWFRGILSRSGCAVCSGVLTCVCVSEGFPLPAVEWPLLESHSEFSVETTVSNLTVTVRVTVPVRDHNYTTVECVSRSDGKEERKNLTVVKTESEHEEPVKTHLSFLMIVAQPQVITAFFIGTLLSAIICCLARKCKRKKQKSSDNMDEAVEMVTTEVVLLSNGGQPAENNETDEEEAAEEGAEAAGQSVPDGDGEPRETEYSDINFCGMKSTTGANDVHEGTETEYAEIKREQTKERQDDGGEEGEMLEGNEEEEAMTGEDEEAKQCMYPKEEEQKDEALYSNLNEMMAEV